MDGSSVLVADDDLAILEGLQALLSGAGYTVYSARDGEEALQLYHNHAPSVLLLDMLMPGLSGLEVCRQVRREDAAIPIIMLTAKGEESDKVLGLAVGADDYVVKPFGAQELLARVRAALRRSDLVLPIPNEFSSDNLAIDVGRREVRRDGELVVLTAKEFDLLIYLVQRRGTVVDRHELLRQVWHYAREEQIDTRTVDNHVMRLRNKLKSDPSQPEYIVTVRGGGYMFEDR